MLDEFGFTLLAGSEPSDQLEVLEDRSESKPTIDASQRPSYSWYEVPGDPTLSDAVLDRLLCNGHIIQMNGTSMRTKKS